MKNRIKSLRTNLGLTQQEFADRLGLKRNSVANYEIGRNKPIDPILTSICKEFNVNGTWLKTGEGEMFLPQEDEEAAYVSELLEEDNDFYDLIKAIMKTYTESGEKEKTILKTFAQNLKNNLKKDQD